MFFSPKMSQTSRKLSRCSKCVLFPLRFSLEFFCNKYNAPPNLHLLVFSSSILQCSWGLEVALFEHINPLCAGSVQSVWEYEWRAGVNPFLARAFTAQCEMTGCGSCYLNGSTAMTRHQALAEPFTLQGQKNILSHPRFCSSLPPLWLWEPVLVQRGGVDSWISVRKWENKAQHISLSLLHWHTHLLIWKWVTLYTVPNRKFAFIKCTLSYILWK